MAFIEQLVGLLLMLVVVADVFLTVLYARSETGFAGAALRAGALVTDAVAGKSGTVCAPDVGERLSGRMC